MCSLNRTMSLSVFPREPAAGLDATVDYVKVRTNVLVCYLQNLGKIATAAAASFTVVTANNTCVVVV